MRLRQVRRHVDVRAAGLEGRIEDRGVHAGITCVHDRVGAQLPGQGDDVDAVTRVDERRTESPRIVDGGHGALGPADVDIGYHELLEERTTSGDLGYGRADTTGADDQDPHGRRR
jgi:hypothetical protein